MGAKYTSKSASGYNSSPPSDNGAQTATNLVKWATHKTKLTDPIKTLAEEINTALVTALDFSVRQITSSDNTVAGDHMRCVEIAPSVTAAVTVSLGDAATMGAVYRVYIKNSSARNQTLGRATSGDTIDGTAGDVTIPPGGGLIAQTNATPNGYLIVARYGPLVDSDAVAVGSSDGTKKVRLEVDGVTAATTRVLTVPDFDGTIATLAGTEALTNKTLTSPTIQGTVAAGTGLTLPALVLSGNVTSSGNPSLNIGSGALTAGAITASGKITGTLASGKFLENISGTTSNLYAEVKNTTGWLIAGVESSGGGSLISGGSAYAGVIATNTTTNIEIGVNGTKVITFTSVAVTPGADNTYDLGSASLGWKEIFADNGTINTSDARKKTVVRPLADAELAAAKDLSKEIGAFQFLAAVAEKGDSARLHIGMTVQKAIQIMESHGLDPFRYSFICYDEWSDEYQDIPAVEACPATPEQPAQYESREVRETVIIDGEEREIVRTELVEISPRVPAQEAIEAKPAERKLIRAAGNKYGFRVHELLLFIARGIEARLTALEA